MRFYEIPSPLPEMLVYRANSYPYQFVIVCELRMGKGYEWTGYTATYLKTISNKNQSIRIDGIWNNLPDAIEACENKLKELKS